MLTPLTSKQNAVYKFIQRFIEQNHVPPALRDIGEHLGLSVGTAQDHVEAIRRKGYLTKEQTKARGLKLSMGGMQIPILGRVHAGNPHAAHENVEGHLPVSSGVSTSDHFALKVRGDSMIEAGILDGDLVVVRLQANAEDGDIVVARLDDEATVKRLRRKQHKTFLEPANPHYSNIESDFELVGLVVEVRRSYK
ncbi:MAG: transcriptional repressor LexA [Bdellovibrionales bacterium]|nr:transcriptional repressor LexA [Bdellovibrionales bacterium]